MWRTRRFSCNFIVVIIVGVHHHSAPVPGRYAITGSPSKDLSSTFCGRITSFVRSKQDPEPAACTMNADQSCTERQWIAVRFVIRPAHCVATHTRPINSYTPQEPIPTNRPQFLQNAGTIFVKNQSPIIPPPNDLPQNPTAQNLQFFAVVVADHPNVDARPQQVWSDFDHLHLREPQLLAIKA